MNLQMNKKQIIYFEDITKEFMPYNFVLINNTEKINTNEHLSLKIINTESKDNVYSIEYSNPIANIHELMEATGFDKNKITDMIEYIKRVFLSYNLKVQ